MIQIPAPHFNIIKFPYSSNNTNNKTILVSLYNFDRGIETNHTRNQADIVFFGFFRLFRLSLKVFKTCLLGRDQSMWDLTTHPPSRSSLLTDTRSFLQFPLFFSPTDVRSHNSPLFGPQCPR